jgi:hypothetical protein
MTEQRKPSFRDRFAAQRKKLDDKVADSVGNAGVKFYGALGGEAGAMAERAALKAARAGKWEEVAKDSLKVDAEMARHLVGLDKRGQTR